MASIRSNFASVKDAVMALTHLLDLDRGPSGQSLGSRALDAAAAGIYERSHQQKDPRGNAWPDNAESYKRQARKRGKPVGILTGEMLSDSEIRGTRAIAAGSASMEYGTTGEMKQRAEKFQEGSSGKQPPRPFFDLDEDIIRDIDALYDEAIDRGIRDLGGEPA
jgi:hypothetical protein